VILLVLSYRVRWEIVTILGEVTKKKVKLSTKITYGFITSGILSTDLYSYVKSVLHMELSMDSNPYIKTTLHTNFYIRICIQDITYGFSLYVNSYII